MTPIKPYIIRAVYEWIVDNNFTPYLFVDANLNRGSLPEDYIQDGKIVLNIRPQAVEALSLGNEAIEFNARFGGKPYTIAVSINAVMAIQAKENGQGFAFEQEEPMPDPPIPPDTAVETKPTPKKPSLRVVK